MVEDGYGLHCSAFIISRAICYGEQQFQSHLNRASLKSNNCVARDPSRRLFTQAQDVMSQCLNFKVSSDDKDLEFWQKKKQKNRRNEMFLLQSQFQITFSFAPLHV